MAPLLFSEAWKQMDAGAAAMHGNIDTAPG